MTSTVGYRTHDSHAYCDALGQLCPVDDRGRLRCDCVIPVEDLNAGQGSVRCPHGIREDERCEECEIGKAEDTLDDWHQGYNEQ